MAALCYNSRFWYLTNKLPNLKLSAPKSATNHTRIPRLNPNKYPSFFNIGALGNYHFVNNDQWNVYAGAALGYLSVGVDDNITDGAGDVRSSGIALGVQGGARYFFTDKFATNVQLGYGLLVLSLGVTLKL